MYDQLAKSLFQQFPNQPKMRSWGGIYMRAIGLLLEGLRTRERGVDLDIVEAHEWFFLKLSRKHLLIQLYLHGLSVDQIIQAKKDNAVLKCSIQFIEHLSLSEIYFMLIKTLDDTRPMEESVADFLIFMEAYAAKEGVEIKTDGTVSFQGENDFMGIMSESEATIGAEQ